MLKSAGVVIGCYVLSIILVLSTDLLLMRLFPGDFVDGRIPSDTALMTSTMLFFLVATFCAWLCARVAPGRAARHVLWFFIVGEAMGIVFTVLNWGKGWPHWYWVSWLLAWPVSCYVGLLLAKRRTHGLSMAAE